MGYQLWTSPVTGKRRTGTRLLDLTSAFETSIVARTISEPLYSCPKNAPAEEMARLLELRGFDAAGLQESQNVGPAAFVLRASLREGTVDQYAIPFAADNLISDGSPLSGIFKTLGKKDRIFVLVGNEVRGIITRADLNKPLVRVYLFGIISLLEMHMRFWVSKEYRNDSWQKALSNGRMEFAKKLQDKRREQREETTLLDCVQFCDLGELISLNDNLRCSLGLKSKAAVKSTIKKAQRLRDHLAHSQSDLSGGSSWNEILPLISAVEELLYRSDRAVEDEAAIEAAKISPAVGESR